MQGELEQLTRRNEALLEEARNGAAARSGASAETGAQSSEELEEVALARVALETEVARLRQQNHQLRQWLSNMGFYLGDQG